MKNFFIIILAAAMLIGCADSSTKGNVKEVESDITINIHDNFGPVYLDPTLGFKYAQGDTTQDTSNTSDVNPATDIKVPVAQGAASAATGAMDAVKNTLDNRVKDSNNSEVQPLPNVSPGTKINEDTREGTNVGDTTARHEFEMKYNTEHNRLFTWLPETGSSYGSSFKLSIPDCDAELMVPDSSQNLGAESIIYFDGTHPPDAKSVAGMGKQASVFGPVGCDSGTLIIK